MVWQLTSFSDEARVKVSAMKKLGQGLAVVEG